MCGQHNVRASAEGNTGQNTDKYTHPIPGHKLKFLTPPGIEPGPPHSGRFTGSRWITFIFATFKTANVFSHNYTTNSGEYENINILTVYTRGKAG